jgi:hypothetical protein
MRITEGLLMECKTENIERLARSLHVRMPSPLLSDHARRRELVGRIVLRLRQTASTAIGAACVVAVVAIGGVL